MADSIQQPPKPQVRSIELNAKGFVNEIYTDAITGKFIRALPFSKENLEQSITSVKAQAEQQLARFQEMLALFK